MCELADIADDLERIKAAAVARWPHDMPTEVERQIAWCAGELARLRRCAVAQGG